MTQSTRNSPEEKKIHRRKKIQIQKKEKKTERNRKKITDAATHHKKTPSVSSYPQPGADRGGCAQAGARAETESSGQERARRHRVC